MRIKFVKVNKEAITPTQATVGSVGFDLYATENSYIMGNEIKLIPTGIAVELPIELEAQVRSRSGLALKEKLFVVNSPGTIDSDYRGEIQVILGNLSSAKKFIKKGDRIAQLVFNHRAFVDLIQVNELDETDRGINGFGSSGR